MKLDKDECEMHLIVKGDVQGVGFRALTRYLAKELSITGTVKNQLDGSVEIFAHGPRKQLEELTKKLKEETGLGQINEVLIEYHPIKNLHDDFRIIY